MKTKRLSGKVIVGTRGSPLALAQANEVKEKIVKYNDIDPDSIVIKVIKTSGDKFLDTSLSKIGGKGLFTKEIQKALLENDIDMAVHSMKDVETLLPEKLYISTILEREDITDSFISHKFKSISDLPNGAVVGTSSLRRGAQLLNKRRDLNVVEFRGNVQKRLSKLKEGIADATFLATAGLKRLGMNKLVNRVSIEDMLPAVAQGAIGIEHRNEEFIENLVYPLNNEISNMQVKAERAFLRELDGSCKTPIGALATKDDDKINFIGEIIRPDGSEKIAKKWYGDWSQAEEIGLEAGKELKSKGGRNFFS